MSYFSWSVVTDFVVLSFFICSLCFKVPLSSCGLGRFGDRVELVAFMVQLTGWRCWVSLPAESLPTGWVEKLRQMVEVPRVFFPGIEGLESGLLCQVGWHIPLGHLCVF